MNGRISDPHCIHLNLMKTQSFPTVRKCRHKNIVQEWNIILLYLQVAEVFTGHAGKLVTLEQTISGFKEILAGKYDHLPEVAFYMVGDISEVVAKAERLAIETSGN